MAKKHHKNAVEKIPTKHQISRWEKQNRQSRIIIIIAVFFLTIIVGLIGYGYFSEQIMPYQQTTIKVNDANFDMKYYIEMLDLYTKGQSNDMVKYYVDMVAQAIIQGEVIREKAHDEGIIISDEEITQTLNKANLPKTDVSNNVVKVGLITEKIIEKQCLPQIPAGVEQVEVQAMALENKSMADERKQRMILGDNFSTIASMLSVDSVTQLKQGYLGWIPKDYESYVLGDLKNAAFKDVIFKMESNSYDTVWDASYEKSFGYWLIEVIEKDDNRGIHGRAMLLSERAIAEEIRTKLINGASFEDLARQYSQHTSKDNGGDLGWIVPGMDQSNLGRMLASLAPNKLSDVIRDDSVKTKGVWWLIQVKNKQLDKPLADSIKNQLSEACLDQWLTAQVNTAKTENLLTQQQKDWAVQQVLKNRSK